MLSPGGLRPGSVLCCFWVLVGTSAEVLRGLQNHQPVVLGNVSSCRDVQMVRKFLMIGSSPPTWGQMKAWVLTRSFGLAVC